MDSLLKCRHVAVKLLSPDAKGPANCSRIPGAPKLKSSLMALTHAISSTGLWAEITEVVLVMRTTPQPTLGLLGNLDAAGKVRIEVLGQQMNHALSHLRYVDYPQAEADCEQLALQLVERFGSDALRGFHFMAIPRGGLIVLGMLANILGLQHAQLDPLRDLSPDIPLVVVDDCSLSGARFARFVGCCQSHRVIFAHLYSHPDLRAAIEDRESRVIACLSAHDLRDHAHEGLGDGHHAWRERWLAGSDNPRYWFGQTDYVCFAWNEPDMIFWNPVTEREERGWRVIPPELCLKNRSESGTHSISVQVQPEGKGPLKPSANVLFGELEGQIVVGNVESGTCFSLNGVAADIWRAIVEHGNLEDVTGTLLRDYDVDEAVLRSDLNAFVAQLLDRGLLE
ncbi:MAG: PqqD family peptide modification chaperone [Desulfobacteraceae bacterium]|nr:MAG: PqqD family peptide modification chaperone [Desulfobacteraceae bacterium]